jgi:hypothetical protein
LRLELFDPCATGFGNGTKEDYSQAGQSHAAESVEKSAHDEARSGRDRVERFSLLRTFAETVESEPDAGGVNAERGSGEIDYESAGIARGGKIAFGECRGAGEEDDLCAGEGAFLDGLNDGGLAACFGQRADGCFFID